MHRLWIMRRSMSHRINSSGIKTPVYFDERVEQLLSGFFYALECRLKRMGLVEIDYTKKNAP